MQPAEKSRNFALTVEIDEFRAQLTGKLQKLISEPWQHCMEVSLLALEGSIQVCGLGIFSKVAICV